jgi:hypothetical protein
LGRFVRRVARAFFIHRCCTSLIVACAVTQLPRFAHMVQAQPT